MNITGIIVSALLTITALLSCISFTKMFADMQAGNRWDQVTTTVGVVVFLTASGRILEHSGLAAAVLLLLLALLIYDILKYRLLPRRIMQACVWISLVLLLVYMASVGD